MIISKEDISVIKDFLIENLGEPEYLNSSILIWEKNKFILSLTESWYGIHINIRERNNELVMKIEVTGFPSNWFNAFIQQLKVVCENLA